MKLKKPLCFLARLGLPALGFVLISSGAYLLSLEDTHDQALVVVLAYIMVILGFLLMISGVFWSVYYSMKSKMYGRGAPQQQMHIFTVDRPTSFPPTYEESQSSHCSCRPQSFSQRTPPSEVVLHMDHTALAPPLYSPDSSVVPDCSWSWEPPPRYSEVGLPRDTSTGQ